MSQGTALSPPRRGRGRPKGQDSTVVRTAVLNAAVELIGTQGYAATSMAQVAEAAGISPSGLVHHYPSKRVLLGAVLAHRDEVDADPADHLGEVPWRAFDHLVEVAGMNMQRRQMVALYMTMVSEAVPPEHPAHEWMLGHYRAVVGNLMEGLRLDQENGVVRADAPRELIARQMVALMDGLQVQWLIDDSLDMQALLREQVDSYKERWGTGR